ncbi:MAG TPA: hypothetical protein PLO07_00820 [Rubrivivax sp.]|nr:hypothetical protein [Rubrivivax sp.]
MFSPMGVGGVAGALSQVQLPQTEEAVSTFAVAFELSMQQLKTL